MPRWRSPPWNTGKPRTSDVVDAPELHSIMCTSLGSLLGATVAADPARTACSSKLDVATESIVGCKEKRFAAPTCARARYAVARRRRHRDEVGMCEAGCLDP